MKIVHVTPYAMSRPGGVQSHIRDLCAWCEAEGHDTRIIAPPGDGPTAPNVIPLGHARDISVHGTRFELTRARRSDIAATARTLRQWGAEVVHLHTPWTPLLAWQVWRALALPTVATFHATLPKVGAILSHGRLARQGTISTPACPASSFPPPPPLPSGRHAGPPPFPPSCRLPLTFPNGAPPGATHRYARTLRKSSTWAVLRNAKAFKSCSTHGPPLSPPCPVQP